MYFDFLTSSSGKGVFLLYMSIIMLERYTAVEVIFGIGLIAVSLLMIIVGCITGSEPTKSFDYLKDLPKNKIVVDENGHQTEVQDQGPPLKPEFDTSDVEAVY